MLHGMNVRQLQAFRSVIKGTRREVDAQLLSHEIRFQWFTRILAAGSLIVGGIVVLIWR